MGLRFTKMHGCGNDFILVERGEVALGADLRELGRRLCDRRCGVGADGLIVVQPPLESGHYRVTIINAGGLPAEMCGNGARCVARYAVDLGLAPAEHRIETAAGLVHAAVGEDGVTVELTEPGEARFDRRIALESGEIAVDAIDTGVPHAVIWTEHLAEAEVERLGRQVRHHPAFAPRGTNVNFAQVAADAGSGVGLAVRTYERGVEAETLACGTGSAAAAILGALRGLVHPPVRVRTRHGAELTIDFQRDGDHVRHVRLAGPATYVYHGEVCEESP